MRKNFWWLLWLASSLPAMSIAGGPPAKNIAIQQKENQESLLWQHVRTAIHQQDWITAETYLKEALAVNPKRADFQFTLAAIGLRRDAHAQYRETIATAFALAPNQADILAGYLQQYFPSEPRESMIKEALDVQPSSPALYQSLGNTYAAQKRWREALRAFRAAVNLETDNPDHHFNLAISYDELQQYEEASAHYREALYHAKNRPPMFAPSTVLQRLAEIQP